MLLGRVIPFHIYFPSFTSSINLLTYMLDIENIISLKGKKLLGNKGNKLSWVI